jgi:hypothetical protein
MPYNAFKTDLPKILTALKDQPQPIRLDKLVLFFRATTGWRNKTAREYIQIFRQLGYLKRTTDEYNRDAYFIATDIEHPHIFPKER